VRRRQRALPSERPAPGKVERVDAELTILHIRQVNANAVALHHAAKIGCDHPEQIAEIQRRDQAIRQVQQEFQSLLRSPGGLKIHGVVHGERDLVRNQREELYLVLGVRVESLTGDDETAQPPMRRA
jgi:hypothetical protein